MSLGSIAGKVFLLGEYGVLTGLPCAVAVVGPRFQLSRQAGALLGEIHPESPAGKLLQFTAQKSQDLLADLAFVDPWKGAGGFGASTAQYALLYRALADQAGLENSWSAAWTLYRKLTQKALPSQSPSGADLVAQWNGGVTYFDPARVHAENLYASADFSALMIFSATGQAGRKVATHHHLDSLGAEFQSLEPVTRKGIEAIRRGDLFGLGRAMDDFADALHTLGLEISSTHQDRKALRELSGVLGVKGAGAMQADCVLVLMDPQADSAARNQVIGVAESRGLRLVCDGLPREEGLSWYSSSPDDRYSSSTNERTAL